MRLSAGRSAVWLARLLWEQEVESSNLSAPTGGNARKPLISLGESRVFVFWRQSKIAVNPVPAEGAGDSTGAVAIVTWYRNKSLFLDDVAARQRDGVDG